MESESSRPLRSAAARWARVIGCALLLYWVALFISTHVPLPKGILPRQSDKLLHFGAFAGLTFLLVIWLMARKVRFTLHHYAIAIVIVAVYAAIDELLQIPVGRTADVFDYCADLAGAACGLLLAVVARAVVRRIFLSPRVEFIDRLSSARISVDDK